MDWDEPDSAPFLHEPLSAASPDVLRELPGMFIGTVMGAEADAICGADYGARSSERVTVRKG